MNPDARAAQARTTTHWQRFSVPYEFPVVFTEGVFDPENPVLRDVLCRLEPAKRHRVVFFVDDGLKAGHASLADAKAAGAVTINYGMFINTVISFVIVAFCVFLLVKTMNRLKREEAAPPAEPTTRDCPYCCSAIAIKATRCPNCTSEVTPV